MNLSTVIIFSTFILSAVATSPPCLAGELICNDVTLGPSCYDPDTFSCPTGSRGPVLCGNQAHGADGACGITCYDMVEYRCCNEQLYGINDQTPCSATSAPTAAPTSALTDAPPVPGTTAPPVSGTSAPTSPPSPSCGEITCASGLECCADVTLGATCYDPNTYSCPVGSQGPVLCGNQAHGADGACGTVCYDMVDYQCCNDQLYGASETTPCTSNPTDAPPSSGTTAPPVSGTSAPTSPPSSSCGQISCVAGQECCADITLGATCYDPDTYSCPVGSQGPILCGHQKNGADGACGTVCYDMVDYQCCNDQLYGAGETTPCTSNPTDAPPSSGTTAPPVSGTSAPTSPPSSSCGQISCAAGWECCADVTLGATCYDPSTYSCPVGSQGPVLCGNQAHGADGACGTVCYDLVDYQCCNDQLYGADETTPCTSNPTDAPPSSGTTAPPVSETSAPTSPPSPSCGQISCVAGQECCADVTLGATCYDPNTYSCPVGSQGPVLCGNQKNGADGACGTTCYDMVEYQCCNDQLYGAGQTTPCSSNPTDAPPSSGTTAPPVSGTSAPTSPPSSSSCGQVSCAAGQECCADVSLGATCYDPDTYSCPVGSQGPILCGNQANGADGACGTTCYDMVDYQCCNDQLYGADEQTPCSSQPTAAPTNSPPTPGTDAPPVSGTSAPTGAPSCNCAAGLACCNDVTLGPVCYDPSSFTCPSGSSGPILCGNQAHGADGACGTTCYDMVDYKCCNNQLYDADDASVSC